MATAGGVGLGWVAGAGRVVGVVVAGGLVSVGDGGVRVTVVKTGLGFAELVVVVGRGFVAALQVVGGAMLRVVGVGVGVGEGAAELEVTGSGKDKRSSLEGTASALMDIDPAATESGAAAGGAEFARELLPMVMTAPTSTPTVMLRADAVSAMPAPRRTSHPPFPGNFHSGTQVRFCSATTLPTTGSPDEPAGCAGLAAGPVDRRRRIPGANRARRRVHEDLPVPGMPAAHRAGPGSPGGLAGVDRGCR